MGKVLESKLNTTKKSHSDQKEFIILESSINNITSSTRSQNDKTDREKFIETVKEEMLYLGIDSAELGFQVGIDKKRLSMLLNRNDCKNFTDWEIRKIKVRLGID